MSEYDCVSGGRLKLKNDSGIKKLVEFCLFLFLSQRMFLSILV